jgi:hypothetical protein
VLALAPFGVVFARRRSTAMLLAAWSLVHVAAVAATGAAGPRYRYPIDPLLISFAAIVAAGAWHHAQKLMVAAAVASSIVAASAFAFFVPQAHAARADYGVALWQRNTSIRVTAAGARAGFNVVAWQGRFRLRVRCRPSTMCAPVQLSVSGKPVGVIAPGDAPHDAWWPIVGPDTDIFKYVELAAPPGILLDIEVDDAGYEPILMA